MAMKGNVLKAREAGFTGGSQQSTGMSLFADAQRREAAARAANLKREQEIRGYYGEMITKAEEGGAAKVAGLADIERTKTKAIGAGTQQMISSGLYGTTTAAAIPVQAEAGAQQSRLKLEDMLEQRVTEATKRLAGFVERIEEPYPDYGMLMEAMAAQASMTGQQTAAPVNKGRPLSEFMAENFPYNPQFGLKPATTKSNVQGVQAQKRASEAAYAAKYPTTPSKPYSYAPPSATSAPKTWSEKELQAINKRLGNV